MTHTPDDSLAPLLERWDRFLCRIEGTFVETLDEAEPALLEVITDPDGGVVPFLNAWNGVKQQLGGLIDKIDPTWTKQVRHKLREADPDEAGWDELEQSIRASDLSERLYAQRERRELILNGKAAERLHQATLAGARTMFRCSLCQADIEVRSDIYRAHYEVCEYCSGRCTYEPSTQLREAIWFTANHLGAYRSLDQWDALQQAYADFARLRKPLPEDAFDDLEQRHRAYYTSYLKHRILVVPEFEETFEKDLERYLAEFAEYRRIQQ